MNNLTLNIYKAFGIRKARNLYSVAIGMKKDIKHFKTPRSAMAYAIKHARQGDTNYAHIEHPQQGRGQRGINRLSIHPQTGNVTLHHVAHSEDENKLMEGTGEWWSQGDLSQRDTMALDRMKHLHKNSMLSLGDTPMNISTEGLYNLPEELHMNTEDKILSVHPMLHNPHD